VSDFGRRRSLVNSATGLARDMSQIIRNKLIPSLADDVLFLRPDYQSPANDDALGRSIRATFK